MRKKHARNHGFPTTCWLIQPSNSLSMSIQCVLYYKSVKYSLFKLSISSSNSRLACATPMVFIEPENSSGEAHPLLYQGSALPVMAQILTSRAMIPATTQIPHSTAQIYQFSPKHLRTWNSICRRAETVRSSVRVCRSMCAYVWPSRMDKCPARRSPNLGKL